MVQNLTGKALSAYSIRLDWKPPSKVGVTQYKVNFIHLACIVYHLVQRVSTSVRLQKITCRFWGPPVNPRKPWKISFMSVFCVITVFASHRHYRDVNCLYPAPRSDCGKRCGLCPSSKQARFWKSLKPHQTSLPNAGCERQFVPKWRTSDLKWPDAQVIDSWQPFIIWAISLELSSV